MSLYILKDWVELDKLSWDGLSLNQNATELLFETPEKINWTNVCKNPSIMEIFYNLGLIDSISSPTRLVEQNNGVFAYIDWANMSANPSAINLLLLYPEKINWSLFSENPHPDAIKLLNDNFDLINWIRLSSNPMGKWLLLNNKEKICWRRLSRNYNMTGLLKENEALINWDELSLNEHPDAIEMLKNNPEKINWYNLSRNPAAMSIIKDNPEKIYWETLCFNTNAMDIIEKNKNDRRKVPLSLLSYNSEIFDEAIFKNAMMNYDEDDY